MAESVKDAWGQAIAELRTAERAVEVIVKEVSPFVSKLVEDVFKSGKRATIPIPPGVPAPEAKATLQEAGRRLDPPSTVRVTAVMGDGSKPANGQEPTHLTFTAGPKMEGVGRKPNGTPAVAETPPAEAGNAAPVA